MKIVKPTDAVIAQTQPIPMDYFQTKEELVAAVMTKRGEKPFDALTQRVIDTVYFNESRANETSIVLITLDDLPCDDPRKVADRMEALNIMPFQPIDALYFYLNAEKIRQDFHDVRVATNLHFIKMDDDIDRDEQSGKPFQLSISRKGELYADVAGASGSGMAWLYWWSCRQVLWAFRPSHRCRA